MAILIGILTVIHVLVALALVGLVLMQKSSEQGVGAAFGAGMTDTVFGAGTTSALQRMTIWCACGLLATTMILAVLHAHRGHGSGGTSLMQKIGQTAPAAPLPATPSGPGVQAVPSATPTTETPAPAKSSETPTATSPAPAPAK
jgi:preprotein translocase subunit SecG